MNKICVLLLVLLGSVAMVSAAVTASAPIRGASEKADLEPDFMEGLFGPTDINGVAGNGRMAVGISSTGTVTVLKWPRPSYHDQVRYRTTSRDEQRLGARENDGQFFGLVFADPNRTVWLRDADEISQNYLSDEVNILVTTYTFDAESVVVETTDLVLPDNDVLVRRITVTANSEESTKPAAVISFSNLALCTKKLPMAPVVDWLFDPLETDILSYESDYDVLFQRKPPGDQGDPVVAVYGFLETGSSHQCGLDEEGGEEGGEDAFLDAMDGVLTGVGRAEGSVNGAIATALSYEEKTNVAGATFFIALSADGETAAAIVAEARDYQFDAMLLQAETVDSEWMALACLPDTDDAQLLAVSKRALSLVRVIRDEATNAFSASVATQPPYAMDWPRDGAYMNLMVDSAGFTELVSNHNRFYAFLQRDLGSWDMCFYGDGTVAGPLFLELDTIGLTAWTLWDHASSLNATDADSYLAEVYDAIALAADFFVDWRDPDTGLPLPAFESDFPTIQSTLLSAGMAWLTLRVALEAGDAIGETFDKTAMWELRKEELRAAIYEHYFDADTGLFDGDPYTMAYMIYPIEFLSPEDEIVQANAEYLWTWLETMLNGQTDGGSYLGIVTLALAHAWQNDSAMNDRLIEALDFMAGEIVTAGTNHYGEVFVNLGGSFEPRTGMPHPMTAALTYQTAANLFGLSCPETTDDDDDDDDTANDDTDDDDSNDPDFPGDDSDFDGGGGCDC
jgi:glucoamylase